MPLYLVDVKEELSEDGAVVSRGPDVPEGYSWAAAYNEDQTKCVINAQDPIPGLEEIVAGQDAGVDYDHLIVAPEDAKPPEPVQGTPADESVDVVMTTDDNVGPGE